MCYEERHVPIFLYLSYYQFTTATILIIDEEDQHVPAEGFLANQWESKATLHSLTNWGKIFTFPIPLSLGSQTLTKHGSASWGLCGLIPLHV